MFISRKRRAYNASSKYDFFNPVNSTIFNLKTAILGVTDQSNDCTLSVDINGTYFEIFDEFELLRNFHDAQNKFPDFILSPKYSASKQQQILNKKIGNLIDFGLYRLHSNVEYDLQLFRRILKTDFRKAHRTTVTPTRHTPHDIVVKFNFIELDFSQTIKCCVSWNPDEILEALFSKRSLQNIPRGKFTLRVASNGEFLRFPLHRYLKKENFDNSEFELLVTNAEPNFVHDYEDEKNEIFYQIDQANEFNIVMSCSLDEPLIVYIEHVREISGEITANLYI